MNRKERYESALRIARAAKPPLAKEMNQNRGFCFTGSKLAQATVFAREFHLTATITRAILTGAETYYVAEIQRDHA
jgi:hypothetical protein